MWHLPIFILAVLLCNINNSHAQFAADKDAAYLATIKAVADFKINDAEELDSVNRLRQDPKFNKKLYEMVQKLSNARNKDAKNQRILKILKQAGKDIYDELK